MPTHTNQAAILVQHNDRERQQLTSILQRNSISVVSIDSATHALHLMEREQYPIIIIVDHFEDMPAQELCMFIRSQWPKSKIIAVQKEFNEEERQLFTDSGADGFLPNNNDRNLLIKAVQKFLSEAP